MSEEPVITDDHTVTAKQLLVAAGLKTYVTLWRQMKAGNLPKSARRPGVNGRFWKPSQANRFLKRIGKKEAF